MMAAQGSWLADFDERLATYDSAQLLRRRRVVLARSGGRMQVDGEMLLAFCSNDYLGLAGHPALRAAVHDAVNRYGVGAGASPMVSGYGEADRELETALATFVGLPSALYFHSGYAANVGIIPALIGPGGTVFSDALNHASIIDGVRLSKATIRRYQHSDLNHLESHLQACSDRCKLIVTDAVFSMDGDVADIRAIAQLADRYDALVLLDDAHGFGVLGPRGRGSLAAAGLTQSKASDRIVYMATLSKALGVAGGFVAGPASIVEWVLQKARSYTYATAAPAMLAQALQAALAILGSEEGERRRTHLHTLIAQFRDGLEDITFASWTLLDSQTPIQPVMVGEPAAALDLAARLKEKGIWVPAIRPPTVPVGTSRVRVALSAEHSKKSVQTLLSALRHVATGL